MSVEDVDLAEGVDLGEEREEEGVPRYGFGSEASLRDRMRARAAEMELSRTERFDVPGYSGVVEVEMRTLGWDTVRKINDRHQRIREPGVRDLHIAGDIILEATVGFWEVDDSGNRAKVETNWLELAQAALPHLRENATPRQALMALTKADRTTRLIDLWNEWGEWNSAERTSIGEELADDFEKTR
jgi:hypothetical protein